MMKHINLILILTVFIPGLLTACRPTPPPFECTDAIGCVDIAPDAPVKLGVIQALSGNVADYGIKHKRAIEFAISRRNGTLLGHPIKAKIEDESSTAEGGTIAALKITSDPQVVAVIGPTSSVAATTATDVISEAGLVMISGGATSPALTSLRGEKGSEWQEGFFRTRPGSAEGAAISASFAFNELGLRKAAIVNYGGAYSLPLKTVFKRTFTELGGEVVADLTITPGDSDILPAIEAIAASKADVLYLPLMPPEAEQILTQEGVETLLADTVLIGGSGLILEDLLNSIAENAIGMYFSILVLPSGPDITNLQAEYRVEFEIEDVEPVDAYAFDATNLLLDAIEAVAIREDDGTLHLGRQALRDELYATKNYDGVTGQLHSDQLGDLGSGTYNITRFDDPAAGVAGLRSNIIYTYSPEQ